MDTNKSQRSQNVQIVDIFDEFRRDLDEHNDRRERLIKASRDVTNASKKVIFLLHRLMTEQGHDARDQSKNAGQCGRGKLREVQAVYAQMSHELGGDKFWRYHRAVSPGLQEYIEALSFAHYLEHGTLITYDQVQATLSDTSGVPYFPLPTEDYLLGLSDLTGELMRFAISGIARKGGRTKARDVCAFVRQCKSDFEQFTPFVRDLSKKQHVTTQSLEKIEDAVYAIVVRTSEYDLPPEILDDIVAQSISNFNTGAATDKTKRNRRDPGSGDEYDGNY
ncbi:Translin [Hygrophoropsis aurantiaca]|uniref:Translin n=1 Tax=Hygrophoropsis aurantiaca TaxID=72124 RepID=A0ACB8ANK7_9AGAM|nr:Translin [Hygrophoropsis aurantiaca]